MNDPASPPMGEPHHQHHGEPDHRAGDEGNVRCLMLSVGDRQEMQEIARPRQGVELPARGEDDRV